MSKDYLTNKTDFDVHVGSKSNPHGVTAEQVSALRVIDITTETDFDNLYVAGKSVIYNVRTSVGTNRPNSNYGILIASDCGTKKQIYFPDADDIFYTRHANGTWARYATSADLTNHINNKNNPHGVTAAQVGAAASSHNHSTGNITSGTLPIARGGTGISDLTGSDFAASRIRGISFTGAAPNSIPNGHIVLVYAS